MNSFLEVLVASAEMIRGPGSLDVSGFLGNVLDWSECSLGSLERTPGWLGYISARLEHIRSSCRGCLSARGLGGLVSKLLRQGVAD
jgi:hypothetical protein